MPDPTSIITYDIGGLDRTLPSRNTVRISEIDEFEVETFTTEDPSVIEQLWAWSDALNLPPSPSSSPSPSPPSLGV